MSTLPVKLLSKVQKILWDYSSVQIWPYLGKQMLGAQCFTNTGSSFFVINSNVYKKTFNHQLFFILIYWLKGAAPCRSTRVHSNKTSDWIASRIAMFNIIMRRNYVNLIPIKLLHVYGHVNLSFYKNGSTNVRLKPRQNAFKVSFTDT